MALALNDRVQQTGTANTTVSFTLSASVTGFQTFAVVGDGNTTYYAASDATGNWEVGEGTYSATGPTLTRDTILSSSNSGSAVTFSGAVNIWVTYPSEKSVNLNVDGVMEVGEPIGYADTGLIATFASTEAGYNQVVVQNLSNDTNASANINISNNVSTDSTGFAELGINSSTFVGTGSFSIPSGAYLASAGTDLTIGTYNANDIHFVTNSNTTDAMTIFDNGGISLGELSNPGIGNIACNNINLKFQQILTAAGTTYLTNASPYYTQFTGTNTQDLVLPDATTCLVGTTFIFDNDSTQNVDIKDGAGVTFELLVPGGFHTFVLEDNSTVAGTWLRYSQVPSAVEWGTLSLSLGATVITGGTWNGGTIESGYGGTGLTTFSAANNAIYSTSASTLTAGTLPAAAGGTGISSYTTGDILYAGSLGLSKLPIGTSNQVLGIVEGLPSWTTITSSQWITSGSDIYYNLGNVGIGTATPGYKLHVAASDAANLVVQETSSLNYLGMTAYNDINQITSSGAVSLAFQVNGGDRMRITSAGNVGIGTSSPSNQLQVYNTIGAASSIVHDGATVSEVFPRYSVLGIGGNNISKSYDVGTEGTTTVYGSAQIAGVQTGSFTTGTPTDLAFYTTKFASVTERMRITSDGNVGIGTISPSNQLQVYSSSGSTASIVHNGTSGLFPKYSVLGLGGDSISRNYDTGGESTITVYGGAQIAGIQIDSAEGGSTTSLAFYTAFDNVVQEQMRITPYGAISFGASGTNWGTSGQVLTSAGSSAPPSWTTLASSQWTTSGANIYYSLGNVGIGISPNSNTKLYISNDNGAFTSMVHKGTSGTFPKVSAIGVGSSAVSYTYSSGGGSLAIPGSAQVAAIQTASTNSLTDLAFYTTSTTVQERMRIDSSGNVGIGTSTPATKLEVVGGTTSQYYSVSSDLTAIIPACGMFMPNAYSYDLAFSTSSSEKMRITPYGAISFGASGTNWGTSGQVLTSAGSSAPPSWTTLASSQWTTSGANIYYSGGSVGINTVSPATALDVVGSVTSDAYIYSKNGTTSNGVVQAAKTFRLSSGFSRIHSNVTTVQSLFGVGLPVKAATAYELDMLVYLARNSAATVSHTIGISFPGFTQNETGFEIMARFVGGGTGVQGIGTPTNYMYMGNTNNTVITAASGTVTQSYQLLLRVRGIFTTYTTDGTFTPSFQLSAAPGAAQVYYTSSGSYMKITPLGPAATTVQANINNYGYI